MTENGNSAIADPRNAGITGFLKNAALLVIGAGIGVVFGLLVAYPELVATPKENRAQIEANKAQIERLLDAHKISHEPEQMEN